MKTADGRRKDGQEVTGLTPFSEHNHLGPQIPKVAWKMPFSQEPWKIIKINRKKGNIKTALSFSHTHTHTLSLFPCYFKSPIFTSFTKYLPTLYYHYNRLDTYALLTDFLLPVFLFHSFQ